jgi:hypothetical protein
MNRKNKTQPPTPTPDPPTDRITAAGFMLTGELTDLFSSSLDNLAAWLKPRSLIEEHLVAYMALCAWRVGRMTCIERAVIQLQVQVDDDEPAVLSCTRAYKSLADNSRVLELVGRSETRAFRALKDALNLFLKIREQLPSNPPEQA